VRLFVAVWPPEDVVSALRELPRVDGVRWSTEDQWHITLRFLGNDAESAPVVDALSSIEHGPIAVHVGPATKKLGPGVLMLPVRGLDELAHAVHDATEDVVPITEHRPFRGHLTLARAHSRGQVARSLEGLPFDARWTATSFALVRSQTKPTGAVYENVATFPLT
jgi:RNA 2',3'-cyclic 3'-phosphodiesterase